MSLLLAASLLSGGINAAKGIFGASQSAKASKQRKNLLDNPVQWKDPEEYGQELALREQNINEPMPGSAQYLDNIGQGAAQARSAAEKGAISSNTYGKAVGGIYGKQIEAYQDLMMKSSEYKQKMKENYMNTLQRGAGYSMDELQFKQNNWDIAMNEAQGNKQAGATNMWNGLEGMGSSFMNFAGTKYASDIMKGIYGNQSNTVGGVNKTTPTMPRPSYNPQQNLLNTLQNYKPKLNW